MRKKEELRKEMKIEVSKRKKMKKGRLKKTSR